jgi:hypothetical protein
MRLSHHDIFVWFAFQVDALTEHIASFIVVVQLFTVTLEPSRQAFYGGRAVSIAEQQRVSYRLFILIPLSMILTVYFL